MAYAQPTDIEDRLGRTLDASEAQIVATRLDDVEELIRTRITDLDARVTGGTLRERLVIMVESEAVMRLIRNPEGYTEEVDGNYSYKIDARVASGRLTVLPEEWSLLGITRAVTLISPKIVNPTGVYRRNPNYPFEPLLEEAVWA